MTLELTCPPGTWQPPTYPALHDKTWRDAFVNADKKRKTDVANMWCWRFEVDTKNTQAYVGLQIVSSSTQWLRDIKPYVTLVQKDEVTPHMVLKRLINSQGSHIPSRNIDKFSKLFDTLCYGKPDARIAAINKAATALGMFTNKNFRVSRYVVTATQNAAWSALNGAVYTEKELATAVKLSIKAGACEDSCDPRGKAWVTVVNSYDSKAQKLLPNAMDVIREMPVPVILDGLMYLCKNSDQVKLEKDDYLFTSLELVKNGVNKPHLYDVLAHFLPKYTGWWQAAHAMGESVDAAIERLMQSFEMNEGVEKEVVGLPHTLTA